MIKKIIFLLGVLTFYVFPICGYATQCDPFTISCRNTGETLTKYPLSALSMAGIINKNNQTWALVKTPDQHVYPVTVGGYIGLGGGKVVHIAARQVIVQQEKNNVTMWLK